MHTEHAIGRFRHGGFTRACRVMAGVRRRMIFSMAICKILSADVRQFIPLAIRRLFRSRTPINSMKSDCISIVIHWLAVAMLEIVLFFNNGDHIGFPILLIIATATLMLRRIFLRFEFFAEVILTFLPILVFFPLTNDASLNDLLRVEPGLLVIAIIATWIVTIIPVATLLGLSTVLHSMATNNAMHPSRGSGVS